MEAFERFSDALDPHSLQYEAEQGRASLRKTLARYLSERLRDAISPDTLLITGGASHGLDLALNKLRQNGQPILVEDPTYFYAIDVIRDRSLQPIPVPMGPQGIDFDVLEDKLREVHPSFLYTVPTYHNPTGCTLANDQRQRLVELAREHDFVIIADEVYHLLLPTSSSIKSLAHWDPHRVVSLGSFSKIFGPGLRLGWIHTSRENVARLLSCGVLRSGGGANPFVSAVVESAITAGIQDQCLTRLREFYDERRELMIQLVKTHLGSSVQCTAPTGGYFLWLELPDNVDSTKLRPQAREHGVDFKPGPLFSTAGNLHNYIRICYTFHAPDQLEFACRQLGELLSSRVG